MREIIRDHVIDDQPPGEPVAGRHDRGAGGSELLAARQQRRAVAQRPAVILDMRDFEPLGAELYGESDDVFQPGNIATVNHSVDSQRQPRLMYDLGGAPFFDLRPLAVRNLVALRYIGILDAELHMFEPGLLQRRDPRAAETDAGSNQIAVKPGRRGAGDDLNQIATSERLAAGKMHLQDPELGRLGHGPAPARSEEHTSERQSPVDS